MPIDRRYAHALAFSAPLAALLAPGVARADLTSEFAATLTVDASYVTGANGATDIAFHSDGRAVITRKSGDITIRRADGTKNMLTGTFTGVDTMSEKGLLGVVSDSNNNFYFYVSNGSNSNDKHRVYKGVLNADDTLTIDMATPIIAASRNLGPGLEGPANHDGGGLFIHENMLYIGVGDTGANATPPQNKFSSCLNKGNGKVLRVNLDGTIPASNPLVGVASVTSCDTPTGNWGTDAPDERIFAWGFRNPWRIWVDPVTDLLWVGDVGETTREEVSVGAMGTHFGYPFEEGTRVYADVDGMNCDSLSPAKPCTAPQHDWARQNGYASVGGLIPQGCGWTAALGDRLLYVFAEFGGGWIHALEVESDRSAATSSTAIDMGSFTGGPVSIRQGPDEAMYVVFNGAGAVYRFSPTNQTGSDCNSSSGGAGGMAGTGNTGGAGMGGSGAGAGGATGGSAGEATGGTSGGGMSAGGTSGGMSSGGAGPAGSGGTTGGTGGMSTGGTPATGGSGGTGGAASGTGGSGGATGGTGGSTGGMTAGGAAGTGGTEEDPGCGCRVAGSRGGTLAMLAAALAFVAAFGRRRSRR